MSTFQQPQLLDLSCQQSSPLCAQRKLVFCRKMPQNSRNIQTNCASTLSATLQGGKHVGNWLGTHSCLYQLCLWAKPKLDEVWPMGMCLPDTRCALTLEWGFPRVLWLFQGAPHPQQDSKGIAANILNAERKTLATSSTSSSPFILKYSQCCCSSLKGRQECCAKYGFALRNK